MDSFIAPITSPQEAIDVFSGERFMAWAMDYASKDAAGWPSLVSLATSHARPERARKFMVQRYLAAEAVFGGRDGDPGFLGFALANLSESPDPNAERVMGVIEAARHDLGGGTDQPGGQAKALWSRLLVALGATAEELSRAEAKEPTRHYVAELADLYSNGEWQSTAGAFLAMQWLVQIEFALISRMLQASTGIQPQEAEVLAWYPKQALAKAQECMRALEPAADVEGKNLLFQGIRRQLDATAELYEGLAKYLADAQQ